MEPCLFRHGKHSDGSEWESIRQAASMEPCLFRHGKHSIEGLKPKSIASFNGAMSFQTW